MKILSNNIDRIAKHFKIYSKQGFQFFFDIMVDISEIFSDRASITTLNARILLLIPLPNISFKFTNLKMYVTIVR